MILGIFGLTGFLIYSKYISLEPLIRGSIFSTSTAKVGYLGTFLHGILTWSILYYLPIYYEVAKGFSPTKAGVALFPVTFTTAPTAVIVGLVIAKTDKYRPSIVSSCIVFIA
jgi:Na+/melibiose symporter-like transporter